MALNNKRNRWWTRLHLVLRCLGLTGILVGATGLLCWAAQINLGGEPLLPPLVLGGGTPALLVVLIFRTLDAFRVFDLVYVLTNGGPGTSTEPIALYTFTRLMNNLRFGYGSALSVIVFLITFVLAIVYIRALGVNLTEKPQ